MRLLTPTLAVVLLLGLTVPATASVSGDVGGAGDDAVVIAVVDSAFSPYHLDFRAALMPQHRNADTSDDLPLDDDPAGWLSGHPGAEGSASYGAIDLTLSDDLDANVNVLEQWDGAAEQLPESDAGNVHLRWIPGTKIVGAVDFSGTFFGDNGAHGHGTSSVSTGTLHGTCPECLVVLVTYDSGEREAANDWVMDQDWIDVVTNSFGFSTVMRDRIYAGASTELQRVASERGQTIFFSAGNGQANTFTVPNTTYQSSQEGPDWIVTVGATSPQGATYSGAGKGADVASIGTSYPSGYSGDDTIDGRGEFGGTSNATPVSAGLYGRALWSARHALVGPSRTQATGIVAVGDPTCGDANPDCPLGDGELTATELRFGFLHAAERTPQGYTVSSLSGSEMVPATDELEFLGEGHGTFFARLDGDADWLEEHGRIIDPLAGTTLPIERSHEERDWFVADSYCRQQVYGPWTGGYYVEGVTELPGPDPTWPLRTALGTACPTVFGLLRDAGASGTVTAAPPAPGSVQDRA